jgi:hypothetical protein
MSWEMVVKAMLFLLSIKSAAYEYTRQWPQPPLYLIRESRTPPPVKMSREMSPFNKSDWLYRPPADIHRPILKTSCHYICFVNGGHAAEFGGVGFGYSMVRVIDVQDPDARLQGDSN